MSGGLYSMEEKDYDKNLNLKAIKPYGDTMNDGKVQLSFTLPVPAGDEAVEAAKQFLKGMGLDNPQVVFFKELTPGFTFFNCYGSATHTVDYTVIHVPKVESTVMDMPATDEYIRENIGRKLVVVGASTGTDAHTGGLHSQGRGTQGRCPARVPDRDPEGHPHQEPHRVSGAARGRGAARQGHLSLRRTPHHP